MRDEFQALREALLAAGASPERSERAIQEIAEYRQRSLAALEKGARQLLWTAAALLALTTVLLAAVFRKVS